MSKLFARMMISMVFVALLGSSAVIGKTPQNHQPLNPIIRLAAPSQATSIQAPSKSQPPTSSGAKVATVSVATTPSCTPGSAAIKPVAVVTANSPSGLQISSQARSTYQVFGTSAGQINNQIYTCTPIVLGSERFAASTDYALAWTVHYIVDDNNLCQVKEPSVNLAIAQTFPNWSPTANASVAISRSWEQFIQNLTRHESGHADIDKSYAEKLITDLSNVPASDCATINELVAAQARTDIGLLDQANQTYDIQTQHGTTQGAVLK